MPIESTYQCYIIADANPRIGTGHIMRTAIIAAQLSQTGIQIAYIVAQTSEKMKLWMEAQGHRVLEVIDQTRDNAKELIAYLKELSSAPSMLLFDSDHMPFYDLDYQRTLRAANIGMTMITFHNQNPFYTNILHNQNPLALDANYITPMDTKKLLGLKHVILKAEFEALYTQCKHKNIQDYKSVLLTFGGADLHNLTFRIFKILNKNIQQTLEIDIVIGALYQKDEELKKEIEKSHHVVNLWKNTPKMPELMSKADFAITAGGLTAWELACCKTVNLVIPTSDREIKTSKKLVANNWIYSASNVEEFSDAEIVKLIKEIRNNPRENRNMVDDFYNNINPQGAQLLVDAMIHWFENKEL